MQVKNLNKNDESISSRDLLNKRNPVKFYLLTKNDMLKELNMLFIFQ